MTYKHTDEFNRDLKKNVYISKVKDVSSFIQLINNIHKSIIGKRTTDEFFYKFDRVLSVKLNKISECIFKFEIFLKNVKSNYQMFIEDLYSLLYLFFIGIEVLHIDVDKDDLNYTATMDIKFNIKDEHSMLIKDALLRIKHIKKSRSEK